MSLRSVPGTTSSTLEELKKPLLHVQFADEGDDSEDEKDYEGARLNLPAPGTAIQLKKIHIDRDKEIDDEYVEVASGLRKIKKEKALLVKKPAEKTPPQEPKFAAIQEKRFLGEGYKYLVTDAPEPEEKTERVAGESEGIELKVMIKRHPETPKTFSEALKKIKIELSTETEEEWLALLSSHIHSAINGAPPSVAKKMAVGVASVITPAAFALNAFVAFTGIKLENLSPEEFSKLGIDKKIIAWMCGCSSELINVLANWDNIPKAFESLSHLRENFGENPGRNSLILLLTCGGAIAAGAIGFSSFIWAGSAVASFNGAANVFLSFVTRFYGLMNLSKRFDKYQEQGKFKDLLERLSTDETLLDRLATDYTHELNSILKKEEQGEPIDRETVFDLLNTLFKMLQQNPDLHLVEKSSKDKFFETLNWSFATLAALSVAPVFAQKFLDGMSKIESTVSGTFTNPTHYIADGNVYAKSLAGFILGSATPLMYWNAVSQLTPTLHDSWDALCSGSTACWRKVVAPFVFIANLAASTSGYNLVKGVTADSNYIFHDLIPPESTADWTNRVIAALATAGTNGAFAARTILPALPHGDKAREAKEEKKEEIHEAKTERKEEKPLSTTATLLKDVAKDSAIWMNKNELSKDGAAELKKARKAMVKARVNKGIHPSESQVALLSLFTPKTDIATEYFSAETPPVSSTHVVPLKITTPIDRHDTALGTPHRTL